MQSDPIVIVSAARTPMGAFQGELKGFAAPELGAAAIRAAVERAKIGADEVSEVIMGCVLPAGQGQAPARQAESGAGLVVGAAHAPGLHVAVAAVDGTTGKHMGSSGEDEPQAAANHEHIEPVGTVAHEHHRGRVANRDRHR